MERMIDNPRIAIIGAGLAGTMASNYFSAYKPTIFEAREKEEPWAHKAVMRLRCPEIGYLLGCPLGKINVNKSIYFRGQHFNNSNPSFSNMYSMKVSGGIYSRSIDNLLPVERYIMLRPFAARGVKYGCRLESVRSDIMGSMLTFSDGTEYEYDFCISTIPMVEMLTACRIEHAGFDNSFSKVSVTEAELNIECSVNQTIYFPDPETGVYRATLEGKKIIIESTSDYFTASDLGMVLDSLGINGDNLIEFNYYEQKYGKIVELPNGMNKAIMAILTNNYHIYSLGRYATWRNITADKMVNDIEQIDKLIHMDSANRKYYTSLKEAQ